MLLSAGFKYPNPTIWDGIRAGSQDADDNCCTDMFEKRMANATKITSHMDTMVWCSRGRGWYYGRPSYTEPMLGATSREGNLARW